MLGKQISVGLISDKYDADLRTYIVQINGSSADTFSEKLTTLKNRKDIESIELIGERESYYYDVSSYYIGEDAAILKAINNYRYFGNASLYGDRNILYSDILSEGNNRTKDKVVLYGKEYNIAARTDSYYFSKCIIPYETMVNDKIPVEQIMIKFCNIENKNDLNTKFIAISKVFPDNTILTPISRNLKNEEYMMYQKAIILGMILWAIISYVYIYAYLIEKRQYVTDIYYICGCSKKKQAIMLFSEIILISVVQSVFSVLLYITILKRAIISIEPVMKFSLNCETYFTSFVINLLIATFVFVLMTKKIRKKSVLNKIRNEG